MGTPTENHSGFPGTDDDFEQTNDDPPTIVVYVIDPFSGSDVVPSSVGMLRCFAEMMPHLSENIRSNVVLQVCSKFLALLNYLQGYLILYYLIEPVLVFIFKKKNFIQSTCNAEKREKCQVGQLVMLILSEFIEL